MWFIACALSRSQRLAEKVRQMRRSREASEHEDESEDWGARREITDGGRGRRTRRYDDRREDYGGGERDWSDEERWDGRSAMAGRDSAQSERLRRLEDRTLGIGRDWSSPRRRRAGRYDTESLRDQVAALPVPCLSARLQHP